MTIYFLLTQFQHFCINIKSAEFVSRCSTVFVDRYIFTGYEVRVIGGGRNVSNDKINLTNSTKH